MLPKRTFAHIPAKITLLLAGGAIAAASFAGAPASGAAGQPGHPAGAGQPAKLARTVPARGIALAADIAPARPADQPAKQHRPHRPHRHHGHRHHRWHHRWHHRYRRHHGRHHHHHARRHRIHWLPRRPQGIAWSLLTVFHWAHWQFRYLDLLWIRESGWNRFACNPYSGAYGIPQALPASKMASAGPDWRNNARTQIVWGMGYIRSTYVTPFRAWLHEVHYGWY